jgi:hypothetical protein
VSLSSYIFKIFQRSFPDYKIIASDKWAWQQRRPDRKDRVCVILVKHIWLQMVRGSGLIFREAGNGLVRIEKGFGCL